MDIKDLQENWDVWGKTDPLWAILNCPEKRGGKWNLQEFFVKGEEETADVMAYIERLGFPLKRGSALDFGCGVGRVTQALCEYFDRCTGVDIAPSMIAEAEKLNRYSDRCRYFLNGRNDLRLFDDASFDFIYSNIVFQHMRPDYMIRYLEEFFRIASPNGLLLFQTPSGKISDKGPNMMTAALPDDGFRARISPPDQNLCGVTGSILSVRAKVMNQSPHVWFARSRSDGWFNIRLGNHWLDQNHRVIIFDDGRADLDRDLAPNQETELVLNIRAPGDPGLYILELDLVQEMVSWFADKGSESAKVIVNLVYPTARSSVSMSDTETAAASATSKKELLEPPQKAPVIEMYCLDKAVVLSLVQKCGGKLLDIVDDGWAGEEYISYRYCVTK